VLLCIVLPVGYHLLFGLLTMICQLIRVQSSDSVTETPRDSFYLEVQDWFCLRIFMKNAQTWCVHGLESTSSNPSLKLDQKCSDHNSIFGIVVRTCLGTRCKPCFQKSLIFFWLKFNMVSTF
jgi:hypothetical protein